MKLIATIIINLFVVAVFAQSNTVKIGYTNAEYIAMSHPDYKIIMKQLQEHKGRLDQMIQTKYQEYQTMEQEYGQMRSNPAQDQFVLKDKEKQLMNKQTEIQSFQAGAEEQMVKKQQDLMVPLQTKIQEAIKKTATAGGYTHIFNGDSMLWMVDAKSFNITDDVLKNLGVAIPTQTANAPSMLERK